MALSAAAACSADAPQVVSGPPAVPLPQRPVALTQAVTVEQVHSEARGKDVELVLIAPQRVPAGDLPVCLALHGRGGRARGFLDLGLPGMLDAWVAKGGRPFAIAAIDGDHYWVAVDQRDDPQKMLTDELPGWLHQRDLPAPSAAFGISMGGFGALRYARDHHELRAAAGCSPALFLDWPDAKARKVFRTEDQWASNEPLNHLDELHPVPTGIWCGNGDTFVAAARRFADVYPAEVSAFTPGVHNSKYWKRVLPEIVDYLGKKIS